MKTLPQRLVRTFLCILAVSLWLMAIVSQSSAAEPGKTQHLASLDNVPEGLVPSDWASIRSAYEAQRHAAFAVEGGYQARNPEQHWLTKFDPRGFNTEPEGRGWQWGLELRSYGFAGNERTISGEAKVRVAGQRVTYAHEQRLEEWFVNDQRGLEHGFTLKERPQDGAVARPSTLNFSLSVRGGLRPEVAADGLTMRFVDEHGTTVINYGGLKVWDADGKNLPAHFVPTEEGIRLSVDERGAHYPITVDPIAQQALLMASNAEGNDNFGLRVAISGDTVVVGAPAEDSAAPGINGDQKSNGAPVSGAAYVFVRSGSNWVQQAYLKASNTGGGDRFGESVAISGDTVVVGADDEDSAAPGVNGDQADNNAINAGAAYVFVRSNGTWTQQAYLKASNPGTGDEFGSSVAIEGDLIVVGATREDSAAPGVNGDQANNAASDAGAVYVFVRSNGTWTQQAYLKASNPGAGDFFGNSVAISGSRVVVGAPFEDSNASGIGGNQNDNSATSAGAAYVFVRFVVRPSGFAWAQQAYLKASNTGPEDDFGRSVAIEGDTIVVGAPGEDSIGNNPVADSGAAYVFVRSNNAWVQQAYLKASKAGGQDRLGVSVAISGDTAVVGAPYEDSAASGVNGDPADNNASDSGAAYVFVRNNGTWTQQNYLKASNPGGQDGFGCSVAISNGTALIGALYANGGVQLSGAAYVFTGVVPQGLVGNVSTRLPVGTGDNVLIEGFIVQGPAGSTKKIILRAIGPSLAQFGVADALANPTLEIHDSSSATIATNNDWKKTVVGGLITGDQSAEISASGLAPANDLESAIIANLAPGSYTAVVRGVGNTVGTGTVDAYDLSAASPAARLVNVATRGLIQPGDKLMIAGFIIQNAPVRAVVRAIGPSLSAFGIPNPLPDTTLQLRDQNGGIVRENDDWRTTQQQELEASGLQPAHNLEAALIETLPPGPYTAQVRGKPETTGIGVVEVYFLP